MIYLCNMDKIDFFTAYVGNKVRKEPLLIKSELFDNKTIKLTLLIFLF